MERAGIGQFLARKNKKGQKGRQIERETPIKRISFAKIDGLFYSISAGTADARALHPLLQ
eukprot:scaffold13651_cov118-Skeletonema_dohrnii-CCMP3373.AAC.6